jgi:hypothetical protein
MTGFFHILANLPFTNHLAIWHNIVWDTDSGLKYPFISNYLDCYTIQQCVWWLGHLWFPGFRILPPRLGSTLTCKNHVEQITHKLSAACYAMRSVTGLNIVSQETLQMINYAYFHSIMSCGLIFWGKSSHDTKILKIHKNTIIIITACRSRDLCRYLFINWKVLPLQSQYTLITSLICGQQLK